MILGRFLFNLDPHFVEIARGAVVVFVLRVFGAGTAFFVSILVARLLGASGLGIYSLAATCMIIAAVIARLGLDNAVVKVTSGYVAQSDYGSALATYRTALKLAFPMSAIVSLFVVFYAPEISRQLFDEPDLVQPLRVAAATIIPATITVLTTESLRSLKHATGATFLQSVMPPLFFLSILATLLPFSVDWAPSVMWMIQFVAMAVTAFTALLFWRYCTGPISARKATVPVSALLSKALPLLWIMLVGLTITTVDIFMLGIWVDAASIGRYAAAAQVANTMLLLLVAINTVAAPKFSELHVQERNAELSTTARSCALFATIIGLPVYTAFVIFPETIMGLFGANFRDGALLLVILATGQFVNVATGSVGILLIMTGHERSVRNASVVAGLLNIGLNALLIPSWGALGAATATAISIAILNLICLFFVYRKLSIKMISIPSS